ncbi:hypothetical protein [Pseudomonas sp. EpS/L25]|uniref:hypothetical protein n=1 Tax=Pseudomonas sp. EpS/L25 TaxID=1749078 RepID=UPI0013665403|nr:hypothetical protein [Pseudomonas sp. EpS/L25]
MERLSAGQFAGKAKVFYIFAQAALSAHHGISLAEFAQVAIGDGLYSSTKIRRILGEMKLYGSAFDTGGSC